MTLARDLTDDEMVERLVEAGWEREKAEAEVKRTLEDAAVEDGMGDLSIPENKECKHEHNKTETYDLKRVVCLECGTVLDENERLKKLQACNCPKCHLPGEDW